MSSPILYMILSLLVLTAGSCLAFSDQAWLRKRMRIDLFEPNQQLVAIHYLTIRIVGFGLFAFGLFACWKALAPILG